ncbi:hypothetical protein EJ08DRAFT_647566 [Tothia fuscella]|uniref:A to I editase domain-containing protein n=1 Tax=Tothia fuscella TaxID=1048955 RepID=A0A9P4NXI0_9PEZI|nr:hypothetical protein EJ08DRAFT_647566 [Tothia fuscella]
MANVTGDDIAQCVINTFQSLPAKRKPRQRTDGKREWVPLSGIVLHKDGLPLVCASLGTGMKCLPRSKIAQAKGTVLHDCHAEILAIRAFSRFLLYECVAAIASASQYIRLRTGDELADSRPQPFILKSDVSIYMYCSEAPCGDSSMELTMQAQEDATPWEVPLSEEVSDILHDKGDALMGRGHFSKLGIVRRKPARPDAPQTLSKSCTDKLSLYQCTSILHGMTSLLIVPEGAYIKTLVLPYTQHIPTATQRAFGTTGRMSNLTIDVTRNWPEGFNFNSFHIDTTLMEFAYSRRTSGREENMLLPSNISTVFTPYFQETLVGGVLQGRKTSDPKGASAICRKSMWQAVVKLMQLLERPSMEEMPIKKTYEQVKNSEVLRDRRRVKAEVVNLALKGWTRNQGDEGFELDEKSCHNV